MSENESISLWDRSSDELDYSQGLEGDLTTDLAIVGGGFTGLSTALHAARHGIDCCVLEARQIGFGGSGRNVGLLNAGVWLPPQDVRVQLGDQHGARLVEALGEAPSYVMSLIEQYQIRCELTKTGTIHAAHSPKGLEDLKRRTDEWLRLGAPVDLLDREQTAAKIGSSAFFGGLLDHRAGTINPMSYVRGLARAVRQIGARIFTQTPVQRLEQIGDRWQLHTKTGLVKAKYVVLGTNAYTDQLWPGLEQSFTRLHFFQVATVPLGERGSGILKERQGVWDTGPIMMSVRRDAAGRVFLGSMGKPIGGNRGLSHRWAARRLRHLFPDLGPVDIEEAWYGRIAMTADHLPRIHKLAEGLYTPIGYNGRGIAPGTMFGKALADLIYAGREVDLPMPLTDVMPDRGRTLRSEFYQAVFSANQFIKSL